MAYISMTQVRAMTDEELIELSQEKNSRGKFTQNAENAMRVRRERSGTAQWSDAGRTTSFAETLLTEYGGKLNYYNE